MRCHDAKLALAAQRDGDLAQSDILLLQDHLKQCRVCRTYQQHLQRLEGAFCPATACAYSPIPTERIMQAVQQQRRITQQLEDLRTQQRSRLAHLRILGPSLVAVAVLSLGSVPLLLYALASVEPHLMVKVLALLSDVVGVLIIFGQYLQAGLTLITLNNWLLSATAFVLVVMMGMWLRLMRYPQEA